MRNIKYTCSKVEYSWLHKGNSQLIDVEESLSRTTNQTTSISSRQEQIHWIANSSGQKEIMISNFPINIFHSFNEWSCCEISQPGCFCSRCYYRRIELMPSFLKIRGKWSRNSCLINISIDEEFSSVTMATVIWLPFLMYQINGKMCHNDDFIPPFNKRN